MKVPKNGDGRVDVNKNFCQDRELYSYFSDISGMVKYIQIYWESPSKYLRLRTEGMRDKSLGRKLRDAVSVFTTLEDC